MSAFFMSFFQIREHFIFEIKTMKYVFYIIILLCCTNLGGCRTGKSVQKITGFERVQHSTETSVDKQKETTEASTDLRIDTKEEIQEYTRTTELDTLGNIRRVQESWRGVGRSKLVVLRDTGRTVSWVDRVKMSQANETISEQTNESSKMISDSRPVQGVEWLFIMIGAGILLFLAFLFLRKRL